MDTSNSKGLFPPQNGIYSPTTHTQAGNFIIGVSVVKSKKGRKPTMKQRNLEELYSLSATLQQVKRLLLVVAEDTRDRAYSTEDVKGNMDTLYLLYDHLQEAEDILEGIYNAETLQTYRKVGA